MNVPFFHLQGYVPQVIAGGREAQYPKSNITSVSQKESIKTSLTMPLVQQGRVAMALRILWKVNEEMVWKQILSYRVACDKFLKNMTGVALFVSSITGMCGKSTNLEVTKIVYPGLGYWIILDSPLVDPRAIVKSMQSALQGQGEIRLLQEPPIMNTVDLMNNTVCNVLKDHANSYIKRRMGECQSEMNDVSGHVTGHATRIVVQPNDLAPFAQQAQCLLQKGGINVDVVSY